MRHTYFLLSMCNSNKINKNVNIPACKNCIYYKSDDGFFDSTTNKCEKFGEKNIVTNEIKYDYADLCRKDDSKCGKEAKYFEQEPNMFLKKIKYALIRNSLIITTTIILITYFTFMLNIIKS